MSNIAYLDGEAHVFHENETILNFATRIRGKKHIPTLCDEPRLKPYGACRVCSVEVAMQEDGPRRTQASCHTPVIENSHIFTESSSVQKLRKNIIELVLTDHPLDCLTCEVSGNCELQDVAAEVGIHEVRYAKGANHLDTEKDLSHPYMRSDLSKCINCSRCVRACDEVQGQFVLSMAGRGFDSHIIKGLDQSFDESTCVSCGACSQACPTAAISDKYFSKAVTATDKVQTTCSYCGVGCQLKVSIKDKEVLSIQAPPEAEVNGGHTCLKGRYAFGFYNHPDRLTSPMIKRDNGEFENVSWNEAFQYLKERITDIKDNHGPDALAGISSSRCTNEENYLMQKLMRAVIGTNNIDCCARVCHSPTAWGMQQAFGTGAATNSIRDLKFADFIMIIGANPTAAHPVTGAKLKQFAMDKPSIVIDPMKTEIASYATYHLQLRPGTNVALLNMMSYYIDEAGLVDQKFVDDRCEQYEDYIQQLRQLDMDELSKLTGVDKDLVKAAAIAYASAGNAMSFHGLGVTEHSQGSRTVMLIANLAMMTGNIGRPGVGVNPLRGQNNVQGAADMGCQPHQGAGYMDVTKPDAQAHYKNIYGVDVPKEAGLKIPQMFNAAIDGKLKMLWIMGEDVAQTDPNTDHVVKALESLDLLVVQEIFMSETAKLADVVLPGATFLEKEGTFTNGERRIQRVNEVVPPLQGTKVDGQIVAEMMQVLGYEQEDYTADGILKEVSAAVPFFAGVKWDELGNQGKQWPVKPDGTDTKILHEVTFKRGKGKFHFFEFEESQELIDNQEKFPYILTTSRVLAHYNCGTMTRRTGNKEITSEDILLINPKDAEQKHISSGDYVSLRSERGEIKLKSEVSTDIKEGVLFTTFHFPELMVNRVTSDVTDRETLCPEYKVVAVDFSAVA